VSFASNAANFVNGAVLELRIKNGNNSKITKVFKAGLWLKLKFLKKVEVPFRLATRNGTGTDAVIPDARFLWEAGAWSNPAVYFQTNAIRTGTSVISLQDHANADFGTTSPATITTITPDANFVIQRSAALTLTDMNRYFVQHTAASTGDIMGSAFIFIQAHD
jgi:hypothetical protein